MQGWQLSNVHHAGLAAVNRNAVFARRRYWPWVIAGD